MFFIVWIMPPFYRNNSLQPKCNWLLFKDFYIFIQPGRVVKHKHPTRSLVHLKLHAFSLCYHTKCSTINLRLKIMNMMFKHSNIFPQTHKPWNITPTCLVYSSHKRCLVPSKQAFIDSKVLGHIYLYNVYTFLFHVCEVLDILKPFKLSNGTTKIHNDCVSLNWKCNLTRWCAENITG